LFYQMGLLSRVLHTFKLDDCGRYMALYPAGALVLIAGLISIMAIPPSGLFISELMIFRAMVNNNQWIILIIVILLLCFILYAMSTRIMHIVYSNPRKDPAQASISDVKPVETISQFLFLGLVVILGFYQPEFISGLINQSIDICLT